MPSIPRDTPSSRLDSDTQTLHNESTDYPYLESDALRPPKDLSNDDNDDTIYLPLKPRSLSSSTLDALTLTPAHSLLKRQQRTVAIPLTYKGLNAAGQSTDPAPGTIVGIVLGSVAGALVLFWLILFTIRNARNATGIIEGDVEEDVVIERRHSHHSSPPPVPRRRKRRSHRSEQMSEQSSHRSPQRPAPRTERILVSETRRTERSRVRPPESVPPPVAVSESREHESVFEETRERRVEGDDVVEVIEEHSELSEERPEKRKSKRSSGFRTVDPNSYAGGNFPQTDMYNGGRRGSRRG